MTEAWGMTAPLGSVTWPRRVPLAEAADAAGAFWASTGAAIKDASASNKEAKVERYFTKPLSLRCIRNAVYCWASCPGAPPRFHDAERTLSLARGEAWSKGSTPARRVTAVAEPGACPSVVRTITASPAFNSDI